MEPDDIILKAKMRCALPPPRLRRRIRELAELTQLEIAPAIGVDSTTVCRWERGGSPRGASLDAYAALIERLRHEVIG